MKNNYLDFKKFLKKKFLKYLSHFGKMSTMLFFKQAKKDKNYKLLKIQLYPESQNKKLSTSCLFEIFLKKNIEIKKKKIKKIERIQNLKGKFSIIKKKRMVDFFVFYFHFLKNIRSIFYLDSKIVDYFKHIFKNEIKILYKKTKKIFFVFPNFQFKIIL